MSDKGKLDYGARKGREGSHRNQHPLVQASESKVESPAEDAWERFFSKAKWNHNAMPTSNHGGSSRYSEHDTEQRLAIEGFSSYKPVKLASPYETPHRRSLQHENNGVKYYSLSRRLHKKKQEKLDTATTYVHLPCPGDSTEKLNINKLMTPKKHGKRSARTRGKNSTLWAGVRVTDIAAAYSLLQTTLPPHKGKANNAKLQPAVFSSPNLRTGAENFDLKSAKSALESLYGESKHDLSIEFAVKLLMDEIRLPKEAAEVEEFFNRKMNRENYSTGR